MVMYKCKICGEIILEEDQLQHAADCDFYEEVENQCLQCGTTQCTNLDPAVSGLCCYCDNVNEDGTIKKEYLKWLCDFCKSKTRT